MYSRCKENIWFIFIWRVWLIIFDSLHFLTIVKKFIKTIWNQHEYNNTKNKSGVLFFLFFFFSMDPLLCEHEDCIMSLSIFNVRYFGNTLQQVNYIS